MIAFRRLTSPFTDGPIFVNLAHVASVEQSAGLTILRLSGGGTVTVEETADRVLAPPAPPPPTDPVEMERRLSEVIGKLGEALTPPSDAAPVPAT